MKTLFRIEGKLVSVPLPLRRYLAYEREEKLWYTYTYSLVNNLVRPETLF